MTRLPFAIAVSVLSLAGTGKLWAQALELRPNLEPLPAFDFSLRTDYFGRPTLQFATTTWNSGKGPMEIAAGETGQDQSGQNRQNVYQVVYLDDGSTYRRLAGTFTWHPDHSHFHLEDYATYTLQPVDANGQSRRTGTKTSFCLMDTHQIDASLPGSPSQPAYDYCNNELQGISVGWGDEYGAYLPGQEIIVTDLPSGDYRLVIEADPKDRLVETNEDDNVSCVLLHLDMNAMNLQVLNPESCDSGGTSPPPPSEELTVTGVSPDFGVRDTLIPVTISGSGFRAGVQVSLENGTGPAPAVSQVEIRDSENITALVTIKKGGPKRNSVWDLRVGSAVLPNAFTTSP